jgi:Ca2+-binding RTX toxin-like protein
MTTTNTNVSITNTLKYANLQMAAEALLTRTDVASLEGKLEKGNDRVSFFPTALATDFAGKYDVLAHKSNTTTGFSGTLFRDKATGELILSFRSTEFADDAARDNQATNKMEIQQLGWAFGQIADMEDWYVELNADPALLQGKQFSVTGYSLGGHLATAFNLLRRDEHEEGRVLGTYTFNGAGVGDLRYTVSHPLSYVIDQFNQQRKNVDGLQIRFNAQPSNTVYQELRAKLAGGVAPTASDFDKARFLISDPDESAMLVEALNRIDAVIDEIGRVAGLGNSGLPPAPIPAAMVEATKLDYQMAVLLAARYTEAYSALNPFDSESGLNNTLFNERNTASDSFGNFHDIYGATYLSAVANSQKHYGAAAPIFIEDQPLVRGNPVSKSIVETALYWDAKLLVSDFANNDFGDTHSLVLMVDSLSLMNVFAALDPALTLDKMNALFVTATSAKRDSVPGGPGKADGAALETMLDGLRKLILGKPLTSASPSESEIAKTPSDVAGNTWWSPDLRNAFHNNLRALTDAIASKNLAGAMTIIPLADISAATLIERAKSVDGLAYRYALKELNPFVVLAADYMPHNANGKLDFYNAATRAGDLTDAYLADRAAMLAWKLKLAKEDRVTSDSNPLPDFGVPAAYFEDKTTGESMYLGQPMWGQPNRRHFIFGSENDDASIIGGAKDDNLYGGGGEDTLKGNGGSDYIEGNAGNDRLEDGIGSDILVGGAGYDTYIVTENGSDFDIIRDSDGAGRIELSGKVLSGGGYAGSGGMYLGVDGTSYKLEGDLTAGGTLSIGGAVRIEGFRNGNLGITLNNSDALETGGASYPYDSTVAKIGSDMADTLHFTITDPNKSHGFLGRGGDDIIDFTGALSGGYYIGIRGGAGNDLIRFNATSSSYGEALGGAGRDLILGDDGPQWIYGDEGSVEIDVASGMVYGSGWWYGNGYDPVDGFVTNKLFMVDPITLSFNWGRKGEPSMNFSAWDDALRYVLGIVGDEPLDPSFYDDTIDAGGGDDLIVGGFGADTLFGGDGADQIEGDLSSAPQFMYKLVDGEWVNWDQMPTWIQEMLGTPGDDLLDGGAGNDKLSDILGGNDTLLGGEGNDILSSDEQWLYAEAAFNYLDGGEGDDRLTSNNLTSGGYDILTGGSGNDQLHIQNGAGALYGGDGDDKVVAGSGGQVLFGGDGNDTLMDLSGGNILNGGFGSDKLFGRVGTTYIFGKGDGHDFITHLNLFSGGPAILQFTEGISPEQVVVTKTGDDLVLSIDGIADEVTIARWFLSNDWRLDGVRFADGTTWDKTTMEGMLDSNPEQNSPGENSNPLLASPVADQTTAEDVAFNFTLPAGAFIDPNPNDALTFTATAANGAALPSWLTFDSTTRTFSGTPSTSEVGGLSVRVTATDSAGLQVFDEFNLTVQNVNDAPILVAALSDNYATEMSPFTYTIPTDTFVDLDVGDTLSYSATLAGGNALPSWLTFDATTRTISGTPPYGVASTLNIRVTANDSSGASASDEFSIGIGKRLTGTSNADTITGTTNADLITGGIGADTLNGEAGNDTFLMSGTDASYDIFNGGDGFDAIQGGAGDDTIRVRRIDGLNGIERIDGGAGVNVLAGGWDHDIIDLSGIEVQNIARIDTGAANDTVIGSAGADVIMGGTGTDMLSGGAGDDVFQVAGTDTSYDTFNGGAGIDLIQGGAGDDTIRIRRIDGANSIEVIDGGAGVNVLAGGGDHDIIDLTGIELSNIARIDSGSGDDIVTGSSGADVIIGGLGGDTLNGGAGDDLFVIAGVDASYDAFNGGQGFDTIQGETGNDVIRSRRLNGVSGIERIDGGAGMNVLAGGWDHDNIDLTGIEVLNIASIDSAGGDDTVTGSANTDIIFSGSGNDVLSGSFGNDVLQGGDGYDRLTDMDGSNVLNGGAGADVLIGGGASDFVIGGVGDDTITTGVGADIIAFNKGDGQDLVNASGGQGDTLSLGGSVAYSDLTLAKNGNNLILNVSATDKITFKDWYASSANHDVVNLQVMAEAMADFDATSADPLRNNKVEQFAFAGLVNRFDEARTVNSTINNWALMDALLDFHLGGSDVEAIGGDLAYEYGKRGNLAQVGSTGAQNVLGAAQFGGGVQAFQTASGLQEGMVKLG